MNKASSFDFDQLQKIWSLTKFEKFILLQLLFKEKIIVLYCRKITLIEKQMNLDYMVALKVDERCID